MREWGMFSDRLFLKRLLLTVYFLSIFSVQFMPQRVLASSYEGGLLTASNADADIYNPFADYSEFDTYSDEEADINFFRNGRLLTAALLLGGQGFTGTLGSIYDIAPMFGFSLGYFFDLRFSLRLSLSFSSNDIDFKTNNQTRVVGSSLLTSYGLGIKYFFNTQNLYRSLAQINPYFLVGVTQASLSTKIDVDEFGSNDGGFGMEFGLGIELPLSQDSLYLGFQGTYKLIAFRKLEGKELETQQGPTGIILRGDVWSGVMTLGISF